MKSIKQVNEHAIIDDGSATLIYTFTHKTASHDDIKTYLKREYPATRCTHSHDCCGRWYQGNANIIYKDEEIIIVKQYSFQNI